MQQRLSICPGRRTRKNVGRVLSATVLDALKLGVDGRWQNKNIENKQSFEICTFGSSKTKGLEVWRRGNEKITKRSKIRVNFGS